MSWYDHRSRSAPGHRGANDGLRPPGAPGKRSLSQSLPPRPVQRSAEGGDNSLTGGIADTLDLFSHKSRSEQLRALRTVVPTEQIRLLDRVEDHRRTWLLRALHPEEQAVLLAAMDDGRRRAAMETLGKPAVARAFEEGGVPAATEAELVLAAPPAMQMELLLSRAYAERYAPLAHMAPWRLGQILDTADNESLRMLVAGMPVDVLAPLFAQMTPRRRARVQPLLPPETETALALHPGAIASGSPVQRKESGSEVGEYLMSLLHPDALDRPFPVQRSDDGAPAHRSEDIQATAAEGTRDASAPLPHIARIQHSFGRHDVTHVKTATGGRAAAASQAIGATAYATGNKVAFAEAPDLHTAAHEAAHVVQQQHGVHLAGGVGQTGDTYEQHADAVADRVVAGESAEALLDAGPPGSGASTTVQRKEGDAHPPPPSRDRLRLVRLHLRCASEIAQRAFRAAEAMSRQGNDAELWEVYENAFDVQSRVEAAIEASITPDGAFFGAALASEVNLVAAWTQRLQNHAIETGHPDDAGDAVDAVMALLPRLAPRGWRPPTSDRQVRRHASRSRAKLSSRDRGDLLRLSLKAAREHLAPSVAAIEAGGLEKAELDNETAWTSDHLDYVEELASERYVRQVRHRRPTIAAADVRDGPLVAELERTSRLIHELGIKAITNSTPESADRIRRMHQQINRIRTIFELPPLRVPELEKDVFRDLLDLAATEINEAYTHGALLLSQTAIAYITAWNLQKATLEAQQRAFLDDALLQQAIASFIVGAAAGGIGHIMKSTMAIDSLQRTMIIDGVKGLTKTYANYLVGYVDSERSLDARPVSPDLWIEVQNVNRLREEANALAVLKGWREGIAYDPPMKRTFDPFQEMKAALTIDGQAWDTVPEIDYEAESKKIELEMWRVWLTHHGYTVVKVGLPGMWHHEARKNAGDEIRKRLDELGVDGAAWIERYGGEAKESAEDRAKYLDGRGAVPA